MRPFKTAILLGSLTLTGLLCFLPRPSASAHGRAGGRFQQDAQLKHDDIAAPELVGGPWLNTPKNEPITLASRKGKVTIVEFWTFG